MYIASIYVTFDVNRAINEESFFWYSQQLTPSPNIKLHQKIRQLPKRAPDYDPLYPRA